MRQYLSFFKLKFAVGLQYKAAALAGLATQIFFGLVFIMVYMAFYGSGNANVDISLEEIIPYQWLSQAFLALIWIWHKDNEILNIIYTILCFMAYIPDVVSIILSCIAFEIIDSGIFFTICIAVCCILSMRLSSTKNKEINDSKIA